ncbi:FUSC family membrane protein [Flavobacterium sp. Fl-77]|uniref:FUSC family membrane protein n=1 Tax=Flavobacterium flavipigmentatum TaxID=2893884 RepID=A0AAJ2VXI7_9FLAO|nr:MULTISPECIES: FUSC family membrane protein [unclassified Flavobacterium]MDX6181641.1 FUSC family membrane protein [Flavobacterium sp. Fl-33]MDX6185325.1 FUSC family membrane protein [Flavobacterium sp. Fl-77]UFH37430.1 FUSC family protein [Flavobacterium sp. F-70]
MFDHVLKFTNSTSFINALKVTIASVVPVLLFHFLGHFEIGFTIALGAFFTYPSDIPSTLSHKIKGLIVASFIVSGVNLLVNFAYPYPFVFYPFLGFLLFLCSMISVYGQRATLVSFSALISISLSFGHLHKGWEALEYSGYIFAGGILYLIVSLIFHFIQPYKYVELQIAEGIKLTAKYLKLRGDLWSPEANRKAITEKQLNLQVELNLIHEDLRKVLIGNQNSSVNSQNRKMLLVFITLVEIQELALYTSFDHSKINEKFDKHPDVLRTYQNVAYKLASTLKKLSKNVHSIAVYIDKNDLKNELDALEFAIFDYEKSLGKEKASEGVLMLTNMLKYAKNQVSKIKIIQRAFSLAMQSYKLKDKDKELEKFLTPQYYPLNTLIENLSFSSSIFRHSLRLTITILIGFILGIFLPFQNVYWILLTIVVIMRPGYGLTKERSYNRIFGTVLGGLIAFGIVSVIQNHVALSIFSIICMLLGISFTQINYKISATFVTMYVVFIYGILVTDIVEVIQFRILDSLAGAILAFFANQFLWPAWEFINTPIHIENAIRANRNYLKEIADFYNKKGEVPTSYRLARKHAFVEIGNLMTSFQRMMQEPKSKQKTLPLVNKLVVLNHSVLSALASLSTYIQSHKTTSASESFNYIIKTILLNLDHSIATLKNQTILTDTFFDKEDLTLQFEEMKRKSFTRLASDDELDKETRQAKMQEAQMVIEQLIWMSNLSEKILKITQDFKAIHPDN